MINKISKFLSFLRLFLKRPYLANLVIKDNGVFHEKLLKYYPNISALPQTDINNFGNCNATTETFFLDGSSLINDFILLQTIASKSNISSYLEIGTWRGESVYNVAKILSDCTTINLPKDEMRALGLDEAYIRQHGILSKKNPEIKHIETNSKTFDFSSLNKKYDLIFIDGDHSYEMVLNDTKKIFENLVNDNTIVVWHDYAYHPQKIRYEVFLAILDALPLDLHQYLYHPKNTMCAVFSKEYLPKTPFNEMPFPEKLFKVDLKEEKF